MEPTWSRVRTSGAAAARRRAISRSACAGQSGLAGRDRPAAARCEAVPGQVLGERCQPELPEPVHGVAQFLLGAGVVQDGVGSCQPELPAGLGSHPGPGVRGGHVPVLHHALHPDVVGGVHDHHQMEIGALPGLDQQRDVLDHNGAFRGAGGQRGGAFPHERMNDAVEHGEAFRVAEDEGAELGPVQAAVGRQDGFAEGANDPGESRRPGFHHLAGQGIGVDHHRAEFTQARGRH